MFWVFGMTTWDWTSVSQAIGKKERKGQFFTYITLIFNKICLFLIFNKYFFCFNFSHLISQQLATQVEILDKVLHV